jgi:poly(A) polymerase
MDSPTPSSVTLPLAQLAAPGYLAGALEIVRTLQMAGHAALFVGGCVRNALLNLALKDIDIATSARPEQVAALFREARTVGANFGVQLVRRAMPDAVFQYEVATFRAEGAYVDRRRPVLEELRYGTLAEDFVRRDFTVNAMYFDPLAGQLYDPAGGRVDLEQRLLRTVGDPARRFDEDALRLLRAVRFAVRYGLTIEPATADAIRQHAALLGEISAERIGDELGRILTGPAPGRAMHLLAELELWPHSIPEIEPMRGCAQPANFHPEGDVFIHTALVLDEARAAWQLHAGDAREPPVELMLAALLHDVGKPPTFVVEDRIRFPEHQKVGAAMADVICRRLRFSNEVCEIVTALVAGHMNFMEVQRMKPATLRRFLGQAHFDLHLALHRADVLGSNHFTANYEFCKAQLEAFAAAAAQPLLPPPLVTGHDLIALGLKPGPLFKTVLAQVQDEQLEGRLATREAALDWLRTRFAAMPGA